MRCDRCGSKLRPCPAWFDGELAYVGYYPCFCDEAREEDAGREDWVTVPANQRLGKESKQ